MLQMLRRFSTFVLFIAALTAIEPLLHHHPLEQGSIPSACAICATGVSKLPSIVPVVSAPQVVVFTLMAPSVVLRAEAIEIAIASRAPPAA